MTVIGLCGMQSPTFSASRSNAAGAAAAKTSAARQATTWAIPPPVNTPTA